MNELEAGNKLLKLTDEEWFQELGKLAASIGSDAFHRNLLHLFGRCIRNDSGWVIRYSRVAPPDVMYTSNVSDEIVKFYQEKCVHIDPFSSFWKIQGRPGVLTLGELTNSMPESTLYTKVFTAAANISDELGMFFSTVGHCCYGVFLEREKGMFTAGDVRRANLIFPALEGFHKSHLGHLFNNLQCTEPTKAMELLRRPSLILDRHGVEVFATESWKAAHDSDETIDSMLQTIDPNESVQTISTKYFLLKTELFDRDFSLAPGGRIFTLEPKPSLKIVSDDYHAAAANLQTLTRRERQVLSLTMRGNNTGQIAQHLKVSKGTVKNCKLRLYRKTQVNTERSLVKKFAPFFPSP